MFEQNISFTEATNFLGTQDTKAKAVTPQTADSIPAEGKPIEFCFEGDKFFTQIQCEEQEVEDFTELQPNQLQVQVKPEKKQKNACNFHILLQFLTQDSQIETLEKRVENLKQENRCCRLIFEKQYEKRKIIPDKLYKVLLSLRGEDGFTKNIWSTQYTFKSEQKKKNFSLTHQNLKLFMQLENFKTPTVKALGFEIPKSIIDQFFQYKYQLLNKSPLLNEIQSLTELQGLYYRLSQQNMGSRILQKLIQKASPQELQLFCQEVHPYFSQMVLDGYGNYVIQKIFSFGEGKSKLKYLKWLEKDFSSLLSTKTGTHTLQAITKRLEGQQLNHVYELIKGKQILLSKDEFGTHFMQLLVKMVGDKNEELIMTILQSFNELSCDKYGIVVLKQMLKKVSNNYQLRYIMLEKCQNAFNQIASDEYGHYIIEEFFNFYNEYELQNMLQYIATYVRVISQNVYSSSIIRKGLELFSENWVGQLVSFLVADDGIAVKDLMQTNPGTFVLHRVLDRTAGAWRDYLINAMWSHVEHLNSYEKRNKWMTFFNQ